MEYLKEQIEKLSASKIKISSIFEECYPDIVRICNSLSTDLSMKSYWAEEIEKLKAISFKKKLIYDLYFIDFEDLDLKRNLHTNIVKIRRNVAKVYAEELDNYLNHVVPIKKPCLVNYIQKLEAEKSYLKHELDYSKKDLLYYDIVDLDTSSKRHASNKVINSEEKDNLLKTYKKENTKEKRVYQIAKSLLSTDGGSLKDLLKKGKTEARAMVPGSHKCLMKRIIKTMKVFRKEKNIHDFSEIEFTFFFMQPILSQLFKGNNISLKLGESHLKCAVKHTNDETRAGVGPTIDIIISSITLGMEISIVEVSGSMNRVDKTHFLSDRCKLAINLQVLHKQLENITKTPNLTSLKKLKLFGVQVYLNTIYIYSLQKATCHYYVFLLEKKIGIPKNQALYKNQLPDFCSLLWCLANMISQTVENIQEFLVESRTEEMVSASDSDGSSGYISPRRKQKHKSIFIS